MEKFITNRLSDKLKWLFIPIVMALNAFGVYIGRHLRFNSWDIVTNPFDLMQDIVYLCLHPIRNRFDWSMIICFSILLTLFYLTTKRISKEIC